MARESCDLAVHLLPQLVASHTCERVWVVCAPCGGTALSTRAGGACCGLVDLEAFPDVLLFLRPRLLLGLLLLFLPHYGEVWLVIVFAEDWSAPVEVEVSVILCNVEVSWVVDQSLVEIFKLGVRLRSFTLELSHRECLDPPWQVDGRTLDSSADSRLFFDLLWFNLLLLSA